MTPQMGAFGQAEVVALIAAHAVLPNAHHAQVHGVADHNDVTRELFLPASSFYARGGTNGLGDGRFVGIDGGANLTEPWAYFLMKVPDDFVSFTKLEAVWKCSAAAGDMYWKFSAYYATEGEDTDTHSDLPALGVTATGGANLINIQESANPLTLVNLARGDYLGIIFNRQGANALDTLDAITYLFGLLFTYVAEQ